MKLNKSEQGHSWSRLYDRSPAHPPWIFCIFVFICCSVIFSAVPNPWFLFTCTKGNCIIYCILSLECPHCIASFLKIPQTPSKDTQKMWQRHLNVKCENPDNVWFLSYFSFYHPGATTGIAVCLHPVRSKLLTDLKKKKKSVSRAFHDHSILHPLSIICKASSLGIKHISAVWFIHPVYR